MGGAGGMVHPFLGVNDEPKKEMRAAKTHQYKKYY
jgi:hypothetical protein